MPRAATARSTSMDTEPQHSVARVWAAITGRHRRVAVLCLGALVAGVAISEVFRPRIGTWPSSITQSVSSPDVQAMTDSQPRLWHHALIHADRPMNLVSRPSADDVAKMQYRQAPHSAVSRAAGGPEAMWNLKHAAPAPPPLAAGVQSRARAYAKPAAVPMAMAAPQDMLALRVSGMQDANNAFDNIRDGFLPRLSAVQLEGLLGAHSFDTSFSDVPAGTNDNDTMRTTALSKPPTTLLYPTLEVVQTMPAPKSRRSVTTGTFFVAVGLGSTISAEAWRRPPMNMALVIDISGSMQSAISNYFYGVTGPPQRSPALSQVHVRENRRLPYYTSGSTKLEAAKDIACTIVHNHLQHGDTISIVKFSSNAQVVLPATAITDDVDLHRICYGIQELEIEGATNLDAGYSAALELLKDIPSMPSDPDRLQEGQHEAPQIGRIFVLTDEQPNVFAHNGRSFPALAAHAADTNVFTSVIGVGIDFNADLSTQLRALPGCTVWSVREREAFMAELEESFATSAAPLLMDFTMSYIAPENSGLALTGMWGAPDTGDGRLMTIPSLFASRRDGDGKSKAGVIVLQLQGPMPSQRLRAEPASLGDLVVSYLDTSEASGNKRVKAAYAVPYPLAAAEANAVHIRSSNTNNVGTSDSNGELSVIAPKATAQVLQSIGLWQHWHATNLAGIPLQRPAVPLASSSVSARKVLWLLQFGTAARAWVAAERWPSGHAAVVSAATVLAAIEGRDDDAGTAGNGIVSYEQQGQPLRVSSFLCGVLVEAATQLEARAAALGSDVVADLSKELDVLRLWRDKCRAAPVAVATD